MKIVRTNEVPWTDALKRGNYANRRKELSTTERLQCGLWELAPGKKSFPLHRHLVTEEALYVVSGHAKVRTPDGVTAIGPGDFVAFPSGGPAHQLINDGPEPLLYLAMSSKIGADVVEYPDTKKIAASVGGPGKGQRWVFAEGSQVDYHAGDPDAS